MNSISYREERGPYLIEAGAVALQDSRQWKPWLKLALLRREDGVFASRAFDGLKPVFGTQGAALRYATELGRSLVDQGSALCPAAEDRKPAKWSMNPVLGQPCGYRLHKDPAKSGYRSATSMIGVLAGIFARTVSAADLCRQQHIELYLGAAANHAELERRIHEIERSAVSFAGIFSH